MLAFENRKLTHFSMKLRWENLEVSNFVIYFANGICFPFFWCILTTSKILQFVIFYIQISRKEKYMNELLRTSSIIEGETSFDAIDAMRRDVWCTARNSFSESIIKFVLNFECYSVFLQ